MFNKSIVINMIHSVLIFDQKTMMLQKIYALEMKEIIHDNEKGNDLIVFYVEVNGKNESQVYQLPGTEIKES